MSYQFLRIVPSVRHVLQGLSSSKKFGSKLPGTRPFSIIPFDRFSHSNEACVSPLMRRSSFRTITTTAPTFWSSSSKLSQSSGGTLCRQNFHEECEAAINKQINIELHAGYVYMAMAYYFDRDDVAFPGFHKFFKESSEEERDHAEKFMKYQNKRGGRVVLQPIATPPQQEWKGPLEAVLAALELEKAVNQALLDLHGIAGKHNDPHLCDYIESDFLEDQVATINEFAAMVTKLKRVGGGLGEYTFDKDLSDSD